MTPRALFHPARLARRPVLSTQSDERLVDLVRAGSDAAFEAIVERYRRPLMRYASRLLPPERAEDVIQQSFVKAYEALRRDSAEIALRPWLYRIAHNSALNALRDRGLRHAELDERLDGVERPDQALERAQGLRDMVVAVQALPARQRDAILLRELEGRSYEEIATALGVTDGAVRQLLNRARNTLRAAAAAITPAPLLTRVAGAESAEPVAARVAELVGVGAGGAIVAKATATVLVTGAVVSGAAVVPSGGDEPPATAGAEAAQAAGAGSGRSGEAVGPGTEAGPLVGRASVPRPRDDDSGEGGGDARVLVEPEDSSGSGSGSSGSGSSGSGSSGSGSSGSGSSGSGSSGSGSSGSDSSGSGSGSGSSGSGSSGSGSSGSGSSGSGSDSGSSGSGDLLEPDNSGPGSAD